MGLLSEDVEIWGRPAGRSLVYLRRTRREPTAWIRTLQGRPSASIRGAVQTATPHDMMIDMDRRDKRGCIAVRDRESAVGVEKGLGVWGDWLWGLWGSSNRLKQPVDWQWQPVRDTAYLDRTFGRTFCHLGVDDRGGVSKVMRAVRLGSDKLMRLDIVLGVTRTS